MSRLAVAMLEKRLAGRNGSGRHVETRIALATQANVQSPEILDMVDRRRMESVP